MDGAANYNPRTVEEVFRDFKGRRAGMVKALTSGKKIFYFMLFSLALFLCCSFLWIFFLLFFFSLFFFFVDVEEFYQQCDPGKRFSFVKELLFLFYVKRGIKYFI